MDRPLDRRAFLLTCTVQPYAWGSKTAIAQLQGRQPTDAPEAELWIGAHQNAPSRRGDSGDTLDSFIAENPAASLGEVVVETFGTTLPFLLKVLAADAPLSLQAHPSRAQAVAGFAAEEAAGIAMDDPKRVFKDPNHKPELICALTEFEAMCGFRPVDQTAELLESLATPCTIGMAARLRTQPAASALRHIVVDLLQSGPERATHVTDEVIGACAEHVGRWHAETGLARRLATAYPGDVGAVISLLLNRVLLQPGEALMLGAGNLHAYICGVGVELMANSDNVLRGGLTPKHVDVPGLIEVVDWSPLIDPVIRPTLIDGVWRYPSPSNEFRLDRIDLTGNDVTDNDGAGVAVDVVGPELLWCESGTVAIEIVGEEPLVMNQGIAAFMPAAARRYAVTGSGRVFRATVGL